MKPVDQTIVDVDRGDCVRAVMASLFELDILQVPHFILYDDWLHPLYYFLYSFDRTYMGVQKDFSKLDLADSIDGFFFAVVASKTYGSGITHAVVMNDKGIVVHDPNPNKLWQGKDIVKTAALMYFYQFPFVEKGS